MQGGQEGREWRGPRRSGFRRGGGPVSLRELGVGSDSPGLGLLSGPTLPEAGVAR